MNPAPCLATDPRRNLLLGALSDADWTHWQPHLERVDLRRGQVLCEAGDTPAHLYFPTTSIVSLLYTTREGGSAEIAVVGYDGVVGVSLFMGGATTPSQAVVQGAGQAFRLGAQALKSEVGRSGAGLAMLLRYTQALIVQVTQTAACNRYHSIDQQFCRRLLLGLDRSPTDELEMTQELAAGLLGVRREGVTAAALKLRQAGVIRYSRGHIAVLDRARLEERSCECYAAATKESARLLYHPVHAAPLPPMLMPLPALAAAPLLPVSPLRSRRPVPMGLPDRVPARLPDRIPDRPLAAPRERPPQRFAVPLAA